MKKEHKHLFNRAQRKQIAAGKLFEHQEGEYIYLRDKYGANHLRRYIGIQADTTASRPLSPDASPTDTSTK